MAQRHPVPLAAIRASFRYRLVHLDPDEADTQLRARDRGRSQAEKRIGDHPQPLEAVQPEAHLRQLRRERRRMRPILLAALDGLVGDEPGVAAAAHARTRPSRQRPTFDWS